MVGGGWWVDGWLGSLWGGYVSTLIRNATAICEATILGAGLWECEWEWEWALHACHLYPDNGEGRVAWWCTYYTLGGGWVVLFGGLLRVAGRFCAPCILQLVGAAVPEAKWRRLHWTKKISVVFWSEYMPIWKKWIKCYEPQNESMQN